MVKWLRRFWPRLLLELNRIAGLGALGAATLTAAAFLSQDLFRTGFIALGVLVVVSTASLAVRRAWPPKMTAPQELEGKELLLSDLDAVEPPVPTIGIIGPEKVGKTTLRNLLLQAPEEQRITQQVTAHISSIIRNPTTFVAILDGRGESYAHQFEVAAAAEILCILLDHNIIETENEVDDARLQRHEEFGSQVREHLRGTWSNRTPGAELRVHILANKHDRWKLANDQDRVKMHKLMSHEATEWESQKFVAGVTTAPHSNAEAKDVPAVANAFRSHWVISQGGGH